MLPADTAHRLLLVLNQAHKDCTEQKKQLEERMSISLALIGDWKIKLPENRKQEASNQNEHGDEPSPKECQDLELLNKALAKALRIRESILATESKVQGDAKGAEKGVDGKLPPNNSAVHRKPMCKERIPKTVTATSANKTSEHIKKHSHYLLKAPYQTDPERRRTRRVATRLLPRGLKSAGRGAVNVSIPHKLKGSILADKLDLEQRCSSTEVMGSPIVESSREESEATKKLFREPETDLDHPVGAAVAESQTTQRNSKEEKPPPPHIFTLKEQGVTLRLPHSYRTAYTNNTRLWEKSYLCQKNRGESAPGMQVIQRIQATFDSVMPASPALLEGEVTCLTNTYTLMSQQMEADQCVEEDKDILTWEEEYRRLLTLEGLQIVVSHSLCKLRDLQEAAKAHMKMDCKDCFRAITNTHADCAVFSKQKCRIVGSLKSPLLFYSNVQELKEMAALKLQVQALYQRLDIQKVLTSELLPLLDSECFQASSQPLLYRAIYTLLCEAGEQFPVLIHDDLSD